MRSAYRVAAPSIRIVPWAALASCWPLPQQLLPVSAAGGGRRRCTLRINSGKIIFNFAFVALCGALQTPFHRRGRKGMRHLQCLFPTETAALWKTGSPSQSPTVPDSPFCRCATSSPGAGEVFPQRESLWQSPQTSSLCQGLSLWERWHRAAMTERARMLTLCCDFCVKQNTEASADAPVFPNPIILLVYSSPICWAYSSSSSRSRKGVLTPSRSR